MEQIKYNKDILTPCFIFFPEELEKNVSGFQDALNSHFDRSIVSYSVKTNSTPSCIKLARELNAYAEVVSHDEYELARLCGYSKDRIVYNGPMKSKETFIDAIVNGSIVNIESKKELAWLLELPVGKKYNIGIRLNINIGKIFPQDADGDYNDSRFGFSDDTSEFREAVEFISNLSHVILTGIHIHRTTISRSISFYENSINYTCSVIKKYNLNLNYIDIGGGISEYSQTSLHINNIVTLFMKY